MQRNEVFKESILVRMAAVAIFQCVIPTDKFCGSIITWIKISLKITESPLLLNVCSPNNN